MCSLVYGLGCFSFASRNETGVPALAVEQMQNTWSVHVHATTSMATAPCLVTPPVQKLQRPAHKHHQHRQHHWPCMHQHAEVRLPFVGSTCWCWCSTRQLLAVRDNVLRVHLRAVIHHRHVAAAHGCGIELVRSTMHRVKPRGRKLQCRVNAGTVLLHMTAQHVRQNQLSVLLWCWVRLLGRNIRVAFITVCCGIRKVRP